MCRECDRKLRNDNLKKQRYETKMQNRTKQVEILEANAKNENEFKIIELLRQGFTYREIGERFGCSKQCINEKVKFIMNRKEKRFKPYDNLRAEMARRRVSMEDIAGSLNKNYFYAWSRIENTTKTAFTEEEKQTIHEAYFSDIDKRYLFE